MMFRRILLQSSSTKWNSRCYSGLTNVKSSNVHKTFASSVTNHRFYGISPTTFFDSENKDKIATGVAKIAKFDNTWLRENCQCKECYTHETNQRHVLFHKCEEKLQPFNVIEENGNIHVTWSDGHKSVYNMKWLNDQAYPGPKSSVKKYLWNHRSLKEADVPVVPYEEYMSSETGLKSMLQSLYVYGYGLVGDVPPDIAGTQKVTERVCFIQETFFGRMWSFTADLARGDTAYTNIALGAHTDNTYISSPAGIQVFHCLHHDGDGGETLLVDGFNCAEQLRETDPKSFNMLATMPVHHEYREPGIHTRSLHTILGVHPATDELLHLRYNHYDRCPISTISQENVGEFYNSLRKLSEIIENPQQEYWLKLRAGTVIFVDNWRVMHGRASFTGNRRICGCYLPRDDWLSRARSLGLEIYN